MVTRLSKTLLTAAIAVLVSLLVFGNVTDYGTNFEFVRHVIMMDTIFPTAPIAWMLILQLPIPRLADAELPEFATPEARAAFKQRQTKNFGDFDILLAGTAERGQAIEAQLSELDALLEGRNQDDADDFRLYPTLRMLSIVKGVKCPANVGRYMERMAAFTGVPLHLDQAR